ncbi:SDR family oxidoreductase [Dietzia maris]|uniref:mycolate reductase n=1 Tax=Dietzia maris TaxID=37915 RepID=UPI00132FB7E4|nr:mycolate reductase [Dietzia maris]MBB0997172.1 SDR family oxidoreductase [Dietzia maris]
MSLPTPTASNRAVVTGASSGIGMALATELARRGHSLVVVARREAVLQELAARLEGEFGVTVEVRACDLADPAARQPLLDELAGREISVLCNNAGIATFGPVASLDPQYEKHQVQVNAVACHDLVLAVLPGMVERRSGAILNVGSAAGNMPIPNNATYAASKAFLNTFSESLRGELKGSGVTVTLLAPGPVRTEEIAEEEKTFVDRLVPDRLWVDTEYTARVSLDALARNKMRIVPGPLSQAMSVAGNYTPRGIMAPIVGKFYAKLGEGQQGGA